MSQSFTPEEIIQETSSGLKYRSLMPAFVRRVCEQETAKGRSRKDTLKAVRGKLHQAGAAYQERGIPYDCLKQELDPLGPGSTSETWKAFSREAMAHHASTAERLPVVEDFFHKTLHSIAPIHSILDLACGLNPLAFPFMPLTEGAVYLCGDIYLDMVDFLNNLFAKAPLRGEAIPLDLAAGSPQEEAQVAFLLKALPCMEQQVKGSGRRLLHEIQAEHLLVSFPIHSLGGRSKGMAAHYDAYLQDLVAGRKWQVEQFEFSCELAYLISK
jgi:16S rRNA (guanine(1405)-N(7))-methyltransferase